MRSLYGAMKFALPVSLIVWALFVWLTLWVFQ